MQSIDNEEAQSVVALQGGQRDESASVPDLLESL